ncbi:MAG: major capsid protein [Aeromonas sobria]|uniref:major capsid protein n=1 Tax=Aeromonas sobria TaxID=646 RepID=UPI003F3E760C
MSIKAAADAGKFTVQNLTLAINKSKVAKLRLAALALFEEKGITTTHCDIEFKDGKLIIVTEKERGAEGDRLTAAERIMKPFKTLHLPVWGEIKADDLQNVRKFGQEYDNDAGGERWDEVVDEEVTRMRQSIELTIEMMRFGALSGVVLGKAGNVIHNFFTEFGLDIEDAKNVIDFTKPKGVRNQMAAALRESKKHQAGVKATQYRAFCSASFMDALLEDEGFRKAYERFNDSKAFREDVRGGILWDGILWEEHTEELPDGTLMVPEGEARLVPENNKGLFVTRFAPANYAETVNTMGLPLYSAAEMQDFNKGVDLEAQSNPLNVCTSPLAVRHLSIKAAAPVAAKA